jgi:hypothetical protein
MSEKREGGRSYNHNRTMAVDPKPTLRIAVIAGASRYSHAVRKRRSSSSFRDACKYLIPSGAPDTGAAQGALPVGGHRVERLLCGFLALQSF